MASLQPLYKQIVERLSGEHIRRTEITGKRKAGQKGRSGRLQLVSSANVYRGQILWALQSSGPMLAILMLAVLSECFDVLRVLCMQYGREGLVPYCIKKVKKIQSSRP